MNLSLRDGMPVTPLGPEASPLDLGGTTELGPYFVETTQRHALGRRLITWDGRVFKYGKAGGTVYSGQGCYFDDEEQVGYTSVGDTQAIGDTQITIDSQTVAKDFWAGGYAIIYGADNSDVQNRGIVGNSVGAATTVTVYLDGPLAVAITADSTGVEVLGNPYADLRCAPAEDLNYASIAGLPAAKATVGQYFWLQTWGLCWIAPGEAGLGGAESGAERQVVFNAGGALRAHILNVTTQSRQHAGFIVQADSSGGDGPPFIMLQISI